MSKAVICSGLCFALRSGLPGAILFCDIDTGMLFSQANHLLEQLVFEGKLLELLFKRVEAGSVSGSAGVSGIGKLLSISAYPGLNGACRHAMSLLKLQKGGFAVEILRDDLLLVGDFC